MNIPIINSIGNDIKNFYPTSAKLAKASKYGYQIGKRTSSVYKTGITCDILCRAKGIYKKLADEATIDNLPIFAGAIGLLIPIYLTSPILYISGLITREVVQRYRSIKSA